MAKDETFRAALKESKRWADGGSVISIVLVIGLMATTAVLADYTGADIAARIGMYITMTAVIIVVCIWQAAAFAAASIETLILKRPDDTHRQR